MDSTESKQSEKERVQHLRETLAFERQAEREKMQKDLGIKKAWILRILEQIDHIFYEYLSLLMWLQKWNIKWYGKVTIVENYVVCWVASEFLVFFLPLVFIPNLASNWLFVSSATIILGYRLINILLYWFHAHVLYRQPISPVRALILSLINFFELITIFAVFYFLARYSFCLVFPSVVQSFYYSARTITTIGSGIYHPSQFIGYLLFYSEIFCGISFLVVVVALIVTYFRNHQN